MDKEMQLEDLDLLDSTKEILEMVKNATGKPCKFIHKPDLPVVAATVKPARQSMPYNIITIVKLDQKNLDHLIAHECGHILRVYSVPLELRKAAMSNTLTKMLAHNEIYKEITDALQGYPEQAAIDTFNNLYDGIIRQVTNVPVDLRIEKWIYDYYPELRKAQKISIDEEVDVCVKGLAKEVRAFIPKKIYNASVTMSCAYAGFMQGLLKTKYLTPFKNTPYIKRGKELSTAVSKTEDLGYIQDLETVSEWAEIFGIHEWFYWEDFEAIPVNYLNTHF